MKRRVVWIALGLVAVGLLWVVILPVTKWPAMAGVVARATSEVRQVGFVVKLFADDHQGRLPKSLEELVPAYLEDRTFITHVHLAAPGAVLADLRPESIILLRVAVGDRGRQTRVIVVHADLSAGQLRP